MVFQDPNASLNPAMSIVQAVGHPLQIHGISKDAEERRTLVATALERVGLAPAERFLDKYPGDLSGGQKQRVVLARAIICGPDLLVADEPVSALDMSVRAKILELMLELKRDLGLTYVYVTHDLATAKFFCDSIAIMYLGRIVEYGPAEQIYADPKHPYTKALLRAIPEPDPSRSVARDLPARRGSRRRSAAARLLVPSPLPGGVRAVRLGEPRSQRPARAALAVAPAGRLRARARCGRRARPAGSARRRPPSFRLAAGTPAAEVADLLDPDSQRGPRRADVDAASGTSARKPRASPSTSTTTTSTRRSTTSAARRWHACCYEDDTTVRAVIDGAPDRLAAMVARMSSLFLAHAA